MVFRQTVNPLTSIFPALLTSPQRGFDITCRSVSITLAVVWSQLSVSRGKHSSCTVRNSAQKLSRRLGGKGRWFLFNCIRFYPLGYSSTRLQAARCKWGACAGRLRSSAEQGTLGTVASVHLLGSSWSAVMTCFGSASCKSCGCRQVFCLSLACLMPSTSPARLQDAAVLNYSPNSYPLSPCQDKWKKTH